MEVVQSKQDVACVESGGILLEPADLRKIKEQLPARAILENKEQLALALEGVVHLDDEGVLDVLQDPPLRHRMLYLVPLYDLCLLQNLHSI